MEISIWLSLVFSLLSGLVGVLISTFYYQRFEMRKLKLDTLRRLAASRFSLADGVNAESAKTEFFYALNEVHIVFQDCPEVLAHIEKMHSELNQPSRLNDNIVKLFKVIFDALGIKKVALNDSFLLAPFTPGQNPAQPKN